MISSKNFDELRASVEAELGAILASRDMPLYDMMSYHMGWRDERDRLYSPVQRKRDHGVMCLLACCAAGGGTDVALPAAAAVELVYNFCQIHEDVQGGNPKRHGRDAVWWVWGPAQAINAGDGMHALARLALFRLMERDVSSAITFRAIRLLDEGSLRACEGKFLDLEAQERIDMNLDAYLQMVSKKTGSLAACAMALGALLSTEDENVLDAFWNCGDNLGVAVQMRTDLRELWPRKDEKSATAIEVMNKKKLFPVVYALDKAPISVKRRLGDIYFKRVLELEDVCRLRNLLEELGVKEECEKLVAVYRTKAIVALKIPCVSSVGRTSIERFADSLLE